MTVERQDLLVDLASRALGGSVVAVTDDFFAGVENLLTAADAVHDPAVFGLRGKVYDGWETRRRRPGPDGDLGHDEVVVRLGAAGVVDRVVVDTAFFRGNYPPFVEVWGASLPGYPGPAEMPAADWFPLVPRTAAAGDTRNTYEVGGAGAGLRTTHVRLAIHPDGGVARLRVLGRPVPDPALLTGTVDTAAALCGGSVADCSDRFYSSPDQLLLPGRARVTGEGWENARRRDGGHDWLTVRLAAPTLVRRVEVDTGRFIGNAPGEVRVVGLAADGTEHELVARTAVQPDTIHLVPAAAGPTASPEGTAPEVDEVRVEVFPDGGFGRLRVHGEVSPRGRALLGARWLDARAPADLTAELTACLAAPSWVSAVAGARPHGSAERWLAAADAAYRALDDAEVGAALAAHPRIGRSPAGTSREAALSRGEQAAVSRAGDEVRAAIAEGNAAYEDRFGRVFLIRAAGRAPDEILTALRRRLAQDDAAELAEAREQLRQIMLLRLAGLLGAPAPELAP
jgi:allantoicase